MPTWLEADSIKGKQFFFEKKNQKTFASAVAVLSWESATALAKAFCFFFSKKKALPCLRCVSLKPGWYKTLFLSSKKKQKDLGSAVACGQDGR